MRQLAGYARVIAGTAIRSKYRNVVSTLPKCLTG
jgi:hypothetical protein